VAMSVSKRSFVEAALGVACVVALTVGATSVGCGGDSNDTGAGGSGGGAGGHAGGSVGGAGGAPPVTLATVVHVSNGADAATADGSEAHPFATFTAAVVAINGQPSWTGELTIHPGTGRYELTTDVVIPKAAKPHFLAGVKIALGPNVNLRAQNDVTMAGEQGNEILLTWLTEGSRWGSFTNFEPTSQNNVFEHVIFEHGGETSFAGATMRGALSLRNTGGHISYCEFRANEGDDGANIVGGAMLIEKNYFHDMFSDCLDTDSGSQAEVRYNLFKHCGNDAVDLGNAPSAFVHDNVMLGSGDKGVSVGEMASPRIEHNLIVGCMLGIGIKDSSTPKIDHNTLYNNSVGVAMYEAIQGMGAGKGTFTNGIIWGSVAADVINTPDSQGVPGATVFSHSCIQTGVYYAADPTTVTPAPTAMALTGTGLVTATTGCADPMFAAPGVVPAPSMEGRTFDVGDFHLKSAGGRFVANSGTSILDGDILGSFVTTDTVTSPLIDLGDPASPFDLEPAPNGGRTELGTYGNSKYASKTPAP
jgi:parallel beta-helix repeat protein